MKNELILAVPLLILIVINGWFDEEGWQNAINLPSRTTLLLIIFTRNKNNDENSHDNCCGTPYCCFFKNGDGPLVSPSQTLRIVKRYSWINYNFSRYFSPARDKNGNFVYRVRTMEYDELEENPLNEISEQFGAYPCIFLKFNPLEEKYQCSIYDERPFACALFCCKEYFTQHTENAGDGI